MGVFTLCLFVLIWRVDVVVCRRCFEFVVIVVMLLL